MSYETGAAVLLLVVCPVVAVVLTLVDNRIVQRRPR